MGNKGFREDSSILSNQLINDIQKRQDLSLSDLRHILESVVSGIKHVEKTDSFPLSIFNKKLTVLESIVKFLHEEKSKSLKEIAEILGRNQRNLWHTYNSAKNKMSSQLPVNHDLTVPISIFQGSTLSPSEAVVFYLKEQRQLSFSEIARILCKNDRTIWTMYTRAKKKHDKT